MNTIILVEDDPLQREILVCELESEFPQLKIIAITTESAFVSRLDELVALRPELLVIDVMLLWAYPAPDTPSPPVNYEGFARAGLRCLRLWRNTTSKANILIHSIIPEADIKPDVQDLNGCFTYVAKDDEGEALAEAIKQTLRALS